MKVAIFEDELFAREQLKLNLKRMKPDYQVVCESDSLAEAIEFFSTSAQVDLVFMDIELADGNCFDIFSQTNVDVPIIFTTAYTDFALKAFKTDSVDYLLKPISEAELLMAINKFELRRSRSSAQLAADSNQLPAKRILCASGDSYSAIPIEEIAWLQSEDKYVFAITRQGERKLLVNTNLTAVSEQLSGPDFFQIARNITVSITAIDKVSKFFRGRLSVTLSAGHLTEKVTVSALRRDQFLKWYGGI